MRTIEQLQYADAVAIAEACRLNAEAAALRVSVVIVDSSGRTVLAARFDNASFQTVGVAHGKALTSVMTKLPSKTAEDATLARLTLTTFSDGRLNIQGALPLFAGDQCVGAVGVSGANSQQDEDIARAGIKGCPLLSTR